MSEPGHTNGFLEYYEYIMPGTYQYPVALNTQTFNAYLGDDDFMMSSYVPVANTVAYMPSPSPYGIISYFNELPCPQRAVYVVQEEDVHVREEPIGMHLQYNQLVQATAQKPTLTMDDDEDDQVEDDGDMDNYQEQQEQPLHPNLSQCISPEITTETMDKNERKPKTQGKRKRIYQAEQGYLVEEPSSEPSDEVIE
ncbi:uncharacterized protein Dwil_GK14231 [Drosophila willistoni]|uniref:Uncharacterized protein n=1 Tax=Drosophila willistoni TaxID=7260 RepID=B4NHP7_DROWI|nr:uncharacterized protein LOC6650452 [Drosophila willistoni]EDW84657.1 uncharacterized protein Dwil_GK14231 [Drosophila willistoni]